MLDVADDHLVVESKGIYSIENFLTARRLMYWQVYLHKTSVGYERMLISALLRAKELASQGVELFASPSLHFFLYNNIDHSEFYNNPKCLEHFIQDRKSTRLNSSHANISYAVFCLKKKKNKKQLYTNTIQLH